MTMAEQTSRTASRLAEVLADLGVESGILDGMLAPLDEAAWATPTPAVGWDVARQVAHLAWTDEVAVIAATDETAWEWVVSAAIEDPTGFVDTAAAQGATAAPGDLLDRWRTARAALAETLTRHPADEKIAWFGPPMSPTSLATARFMETWAHAHDVAEAIGVAATHDDRVRHVVHLGVRTRNFAFLNRGLAPPTEEFRVELTLPGGALASFGPQDAAQSVRGPAYDFALLVTQRRPRALLDLVAEGLDADRWLDIAQAFAGPPGQGRGVQGRGAQ